MLRFAAHLGKALAAIHRAILARLEGNPGLPAAGGAHSSIHFTFTLGGVLTGVAAGFAALRLVYKALGSVEFLLSCGKHKFLAAFLADESLVLVH